MPEMSYKKRSFVHRISEKRWLKAQKWELRCWQKQDVPYTIKGKLQKLIKTLLQRLYIKSEPLKKPDSANFWWAEIFDNYKFIPPLIDNALELGCGPYTNIRLILRKRKIKHVFCNDPLAKEYVKLSRGWLAWAYQNTRVLIDDHPAEKAPFASDFFDLVIVINVLDHVKDLKPCLKEAIRITKPDGLLLLGQELINKKDLEKRTNIKDIGHPISVHHKTLDKILLPLFKPVMHKVLPREKGRNPPYHYGTYIFAGKKIKNRK